MLAAADALALVHAELGQPPITVLDPSASPRALRRAVAAAAHHPGGGLLALLGRDAGALTLSRTWLATGPRVALQVLPVEEGALLLAHVSGTGERATPTRPTPPAWSTPDAAPVPGATAHDLDDDVLRRLLDGVDERYPAPCGTNEERYLGRRGLLALDGRRWRPTLAALLVAGRRPELFVPGCAVELEADGAHQALGGTVPEMVARIGEGLLDGVDPDLLAEVLLNALVHRDWSVEAPVRVALADERLVVTSPGTLAAGAPQRAAHRNPLLVHLAAALGLTNGEGRGLRDVARRLEGMRRPPFSLVERHGEVWFVADVRRPQPPARRPGPRVRAVAPAGAEEPPARPPERASTPTKPPVVEPPRVAAPAPALAEDAGRAAVPALLPRDPDDRAEAVLAALRAQGTATTREVAAALGCSRPVIGKVLTALVADGRVRPTVTAGRSPFQSYEVAEDHQDG